MPTVKWQTLTDEQVSDLIRQGRIEQERRTTLERVPGQVAQAADQYAEAGGERSDLVAKVKDSKQK